MDIISILEEFTDKQTLMKNHPLRTANTRDKEGFLYGLALVMSTGAGISDDEKKYLSSLIRSLDIDSNLLNNFVEFVKNPRKAELSSLQKVLKSEAYRIPFFIDTIMLTYQDGQFTEDEKNMIEQFRLLSGLEKKDFDDLKSALYVIANKKIKNEKHKIYSAIVNSSVNRENFFYLLDYLKIGKEDLEYTNSIGVEFVYIPAGKFMMGSPAFDLLSGENEKPQHQVNITNPFYMAKSPITQKQWQKVMGYNPSHFEGEDKPVENVSWNDVQNFIRNLNQKENRGELEYRLPTEAEWEYAARAGTDTIYYWGNTIDGAYAWYDQNSEKKSQGVKRKLANRWILYDMLGNVWEWCQDWYDGEYYKKSPVDNPANLSGGNYRGLRGGSWDYTSKYLRISYRYGLAPVLRNSFVGFRLVRAAF